MEKLNEEAAYVQQDAHNWDINNANFQRETEARDQIISDNAEHKKQLVALSTELKALRLYYNQRYYLHVNMDDAIRNIFFESVAHAIQWKPTRHWWNATAYKHSKGIYFYDFHNHNFQMHVHQKTWGASIDSVQIKLYSEGHGKASHYKIKGEAIAKRFMTDYAPSQHVAVNVV